MGNGVIPDCFEVTLIPCVTLSSSATHVSTDFSALFDKDRPMPVDVSLDSIRHRVGERIGVDYDDGPSECFSEKSVFQRKSW